MEITNKLLLERMQHLENKQYATTTIEGYFTDFKLFMEWRKMNIGTTITTEKITLIEIEKRKTVLLKTLTPKTSIYYTIRPTLSQ